MGKETKKISIDAVKTGMFLEDVFGPNNQMLFSANTIITSKTQIERLKQRGIKNVYINIERGADVAASVNSAEKKVDDTAQREIAYYQEIEKAKEIQQKTLDTVRDTLHSIRIGKSFTADNVEKAAEEIVGSITRNPDALISLSQIKGYDEYTYVHSINVSILMSSLAHELQYSPDAILQTTIGGMLHDIGKMRVPESILNKPGKFADWEFAVMKKHPEHGIAILNEEKLKVSDRARDIIIQHHERFNGTGYPYGLKEKQINETGLISAVADVYDALTTERIYREAWTPQKALGFIFQGCDVDYSRMIVERFTKHLGIYPVGSFVKLVSGEMGVVTRVNSGHLLAPMVTILFSENGRRLKEPVEYDLSQKQKESQTDGFTIAISLNPKPFRVNIADYILP